MVKQPITFKKFAKGCAFIALGMLTVAFYIYMRINSSYNHLNISKQELEQYNDWLLSWCNPYIYFSLFFGSLSLILHLLYVISKKVNKID
ncbi:hypothetical protein GS067_004355 [Salmonella enterica]|nr:hypothetical protein [Salmonella enterica]EDS3658910.1 hypothetical protein [Salmonella enterica]EDT3705065.1 hypothetical protein [Salmonella enterica subsp. enterica serovar Javiana]EJY3959081.1 hypothetical protein [Salmonella enterica]